MGEAKRKRLLDAMTFDARLQYQAIRVVANAEWLVQNQVAEWREIEMPDGKKHIVLSFPETIWTLDGDMLILRKQDK